ncbi:hypothetical protein L506_1234 [Bordetella bronchiseptica GA96-01]|nr:hypothetical protein L572_1271 [Bordetella bronchiseptica 345]KDC37655.1 hypothetical protein L506_1234 [Bordetella bronchiseptica GA96-01]
MPGEGAWLPPRGSSRAGRPAQRVPGESAWLPPRGSSRAGRPAQRVPGTEVPSPRARPQGVRHPPHAACCLPWPA